MGLAQNKLLHAIPMLQKTILPIKIAIIWDHFTHSIIFSYIFSIHSPTIIFTIHWHRWLANLGMVACHPACFSFAILCLDNIPNLPKSHVRGKYCRFEQNQIPDFIGWSLPYTGKLFEPALSNTSACPHFKGNVDVSWGALAPMDTKNQTHKQHLEMPSLGVGVHHDGIARFEYVLQ